MKLTAAHKPWAIWGPPGDPTSNQRLLMGWRVLKTRNMERTLLCCGLNPSTAWAQDGEGELDPTLTRLHGFAERWGLAHVVMMNLYPHRATDPKEMWPMLEGWNAAEYVQGLPDLWARAPVDFAKTLVLAGWGNTWPPPWKAGSGWAWPQQLHRHHVRQMHNQLGTLGEVMCLGATKDGHPRHPLYVRGDTKPQPYMRLE